MIKIELSIKERNMLIHILKKFEHQIVNDTEMMDAYMITRDLSGIQVKNYILHLEGHYDEEAKDSFKYSDLHKFLDKIYN
tara:strand:- start:76 stop:315 length:240 start_codon:yes stop_codon:yes gene_type:complete